MSPSYCSCMVQLLGVLLCLVVHDAYLLAYLGGQQILIKRLPPYRLDNLDHRQMVYSPTATAISAATATPPLIENLENRKTLRDTFLDERMTFSRDLVEPYVHRKKKRVNYPLIERTLLHYKYLNGNMLVPQIFTVPKSTEWPEESWDLKLGLAVSSLRKGTQAAKHDRLSSLGFCFNALHAKYELAKLALLNYKQLNGDMRVLACFEVPTDSALWPKETWGLKLGTIVRNIRSGDSHADKRDDLLCIGFCFDTVQARYDLAKVALIRYRKLYGDMLVPSKFEVPDKCINWPQETWGLHLGLIAGSMRRGSYAEKHAELAEIGFDFDSQHARYGYESTRQVLLIYRDLYGNMGVPARFTVPRNVIWPERTWGMKLGYTVKDIRYGRIYRDERQDLIKIGFNFNMIKKKTSFDLILKALLKYKDIYSDLLVPQLYIIPSNSEEWPSDTWGINLGAIVARLRSGYYADRKDELISIGFIFSVRKKYDYDTVKCAINCYKGLYGSTCVPAKYRISVGRNLYPEKTWGMYLGRYAKRIKAGLLWPEHAESFFE